MRPTLVSPPSTYLHFAVLILVCLLPILSLSAAVGQAHYRKDGEVFAVKYPSDPKITPGPALSHDHQVSKFNDDLHDSLDLKRRQKGDDEEDEEDDDDEDSESSRPPIASTRTVLTPSSKPDSDSTTINSAATSSIEPTKTTSSTTVATEIVVATQTPSPKPLPHPFDTNRGNNFTSATCSDFFDGFLADKTFKECHPISLLLRNSNSFFKATKSFVETTQSLDRSCDAPKDKCVELFSSLSKDITGEKGCTEEIQNGDPMAIQAYNGFMAYSFVRDAACLKSPETDNYCLADAASNSTNPADYYIYYLSLGFALPGSSRPTCSKCLQATMEIFLEAAKDKDQALHDTYASAAEQINIGCGPSFVGSFTPDKSAGTALKPWATPYMLLSLIGYTLLLSCGIPYIIAP